MNTKTKIVVASQRLFLNNGFKSITMDDVAQNIGMSKRTIYENFENKRSLIVACIDYVHRQKIKEEDEIISKAENIIDELALMLERTKTTKERERERYMAMELQKFYPEIYYQEYQKRYDEMSIRLSARIQRGIDQELIIPTTNIRLAVFVIFETIYSLISQPNRMVDTQIDILEAFRYVLISFFRGIATPKGVEMIDKVIK